MIQIINLHVDPTYRCDHPYPLVNLVEVHLQLVNDHDEPTHNGHGYVIIFSPISRK